MSDFAASAMMRLIGLGLARRGLVLPEAPPRGARVPLARKRALLDRLLQEHGPATLLEIGQAIDDAPDEPLLTALALARDPIDLVRRWQRLERFVHSRHRTVVRTLGDRHVLLKHVSLDPGTAPNAAENLLIFGLLTALLNRIASGQARVRFTRQRRWHTPDCSWPQAMPKRTNALEVRWHRAAPASLPIRLDQSGDLAALAGRTLAADVGHSWRLSLLARRLGIAPRSLQRQLGKQGTNFSWLLTDVRLAEAARLLACTPQPLAAIGYVCGFSDQAHFTRKLKQHAALTPSEFRRQFAVTRSPLGGT